MFMLRFVYCSLSCSFMFWLSWLAPCTLYLHFCLVSFRCRFSFSVCVFLSLRVCGFVFILVFVLVVGFVFVFVLVFVFGLVVGFDSVFEMCVVFSVVIVLVFALVQDFDLVVVDVVVVAGLLMVRYSCCVRFIPRSHGRVRFRIRCWLRFVLCVHSSFSFVLVFAGVVNVLLLFVIIVLGIIACIWFRFSVRRRVRAFMLRFKLSFTLCLVLVPVVVCVLLI